MQIHSEQICNTSARKFLDLNACLFEQKTLTLQTFTYNSYNIHHLGYSQCSLYNSKSVIHIDQYGARRSGKKRQGI